MSPWGVPYSSYIKYHEEDLEAVVTEFAFLMAALTDESKWPGDFLQRISKRQRTLPTRLWLVVSPETYVLMSQRWNLISPGCVAPGLDF